MDKNFWYLKNCDLFERLSQDQIAHVERNSSDRNFARGNMVYLPTESSDSVYLLVSGRIKLYHLTGEGKQLVVKGLETGVRLQSPPETAIARSPGWLAEGALR